jgi:hypothetical protein
VQVKNKSCVEYIIMHLISWNRSRGIETRKVFAVGKCKNYEDLNNI